MTNLDLKKLNDFAVEHWNAMTEMPENQAADYLTAGRMAAEGILCAVAAGSDVNPFDALRRLMEVNHRVGSVAWVYLTDREDWMPPLRAAQPFSGAGSGATELFSGPRSAH